MSDISVILLTLNEEIHIERCIRSLLPVAKHIFVVDSFSSDRTVEIAERLGVEVFQHAYVNQAKQFQWALNSLPLETDWVMRMDADEYLEADLIAEIPDALVSAPEDLMGFYVRRKVFFLGKWIRHGAFYPQTLMRIWRKGQGRIEQRWMDEHIVLSPDAKSRMLKGNLVDDNLKGVTFWIDKHNGYASREMVDLLNIKYHFLERDDSLKTMESSQAGWKRLIKDNLYSKLPLGLRPTFYFFYRYVLRLGFLDGTKGFFWHFMQAYWYRALVDLKIMEIEERSGGDVEIIRQILADEFGIKL